MICADNLALTEMRRRGGTWAAYRNEAMDSGNHGHLQFLRVGPDCTYRTPPESYPADTEAGAGWRYLYKGMVDLQTGRVREAA